MTSNEKVVVVTATLMASTASLTLRWAGNAMLALVTVMVVAQWLSGQELIDLGFALTPTAFWVAAWVAKKSEHRIVDRAAAAARQSR